ncbi:UPF0764 protein C16orf89 homolog [Denticeps clupeoides]|uniref:Uncharacterized protein n=1 Tax=Denticeps clupeoides TaxID=299321 RepID=A0AAY4CT11_9TELE|nr:UPF0764 protein C16orf89 homolog [Denticeps clupeoides]
MDVGIPDGRSCAAVTQEKRSRSLSGRNPAMMVKYHTIANLIVVLGAVHAARQEVVDDVIWSLSKGVTFLERQFRNINLDGVVGYKILHVELLEAVRLWPRDLESLSQRSAVVALVKRLDNSLSQAVRSLQGSDPKYYREFEPLMETSFWSLPHKWSATDPSLVYTSVRAMECFDEQFSDKCLTLLLGTWKDNGTPCIVTKTCRDTMTRFGCPHYSLSHQLLYFMIGTMNGCSRMLRGEMRLSHVNMTVRHYQKLFCSNMMKSNQDLSKNGFLGQTQDIFIENILLCGLAGFSDFYKQEWLEHIFMWQDLTSGCFGKEEDFSFSFVEELLDIEPHRRVKRREKTLQDGCSSHMTGVAMSALGGYLKYYISEHDITKRPLS